MIMVIIQRWVYILNLEKVIQTSALIFSVDLAAIVQSERHYSNGGGGGGGGRETTSGHHYCKFGNFRENFIFANSVKRQIYELKKSQVEHYLPISVKDI